MIMERYIRRRSGISHRLCWLANNNRAQPVAPFPLDSRWLRKIHVIDSYMQSVNDSRQDPIRFHANAFAINIDFASLAVIDCAKQQPARLSFEIRRTLPCRIDIFPSDRGVIIVLSFYTESILLLNRESGRSSYFPIATIFARFRKISFRADGVALLFLFLFLCFAWKSLGVTRAKATEFRQDHRMFHPSINGKPNCDSRLSGAAIKKNVLNVNFRE